MAGDTSTFGLNQHHENCLINYLRFSSYQRSLRLKAVDCCFNQVRSNRLLEDTYTKEEVWEMLQSLEGLMRGEMELELLNTSHTTSLMLVQLFQQAEKWHLKLQPDVSELENRELLENMRSFENVRLNSSGDLKSGLKLLPINGTGASELLKMEIQRLNVKGRQMKDKLKTAESQAEELLKDKSKMRTEYDLMMMMNDNSMPMNSDEIEGLRRQLSGLESNFQRESRLASNQAQDLTSTKHELLKIQEMLEMAEKELERKVSQTVPFQNLKAMVVKKNEQIKELRSTLSKYESTGD